MYYYISLSVKAIIKFVITVYFKEFSTRQFLMTMFSSIEIKMLHILNIKFRLSINIITVPQRYIFHLLCDIFSLSSVKSLGFYFMILCSVNDYFPVFY